MERIPSAMGSRSSRGATPANLSQEERWALDEPWPPVDESEPEQSALSGGAVEITITAGNLRNGHLYLRKARHLIPDDAIGGSNTAQRAPRSLRILFDTGVETETDLAGDKMILRDRASVRRFFIDVGIEAGATIRISRGPAGTLHIGRVDPA
jgi:hypothetical protein